MKQTINFTDFTNAFAAYHREDNFTYAGLRALFDYLEALEDDIGEAIELDVIALCCDYTEFESIEAINAEYSENFDTVDDVAYHTQVIEVDGGGLIIGCY